MVKNDIEATLINNFLLRFPQEAAEILNSSSEKEILSYLNSQPEEFAKEIFLRLDSDVATQVLKAIDNNDFTKLFTNIDPYISTILLSRLPESEVKKKLILLPEKLSSEITKLLTYPPDSAGFLMDTRIITYKSSMTVEEVLTKLRTLQDKKIFTLYVVDEEQKLIGKIPLQSIAISSPHQTLKELVEDSKSIHLMSPRDEVVDLLKDGKFISLPVVDHDGILLGIIRYDALVSAAQQEATEDVLTMFGAGREEKALSKVGFAVRKRLPWLQINLVTAFLAASVVGIFEDTIARITVLAVFLPVVAGQSGNTGSQALAVTIRGLALREIRLSQWLRVARKEASVGFINGVVVSLTTAIIVYFWASSFGLAVVIGTSMVFSMVIAGFSGAVIPIFLKSVGQDPAQSSSIVLTTVTDIVGFMSFLGLATLLSATLGIT